MVDLASIRERVERPWNELNEIRDIILEVQALTELIQKEQIVVNVCTDTANWHGPIFLDRAMKNIDLTPPVVAIIQKRITDLTEEINIKSDKWR